MSLNLADYENKIPGAVKAFWGNRAAAKQKQLELGKTDQGERAGVTGGKNMDGFLSLVADLVHANGLKDAIILSNGRVLTLPGFLRPTKLWDIVVLKDKHLIAALEFKSQVGPSFGNNYNNRSEEAIGNAIDVWTAYREGRFGTVRPWLGYLFLLEEAPGSIKPVRVKQPFFEVDPIFLDASYKKRYEILCRRL